MVKQKVNKAENAQPDRASSPLPALPARIKISLEGESPRTVNTSDYVRAKVKALQEFGYAGLLVSDAKEQLQHVLAGHSMSEGLTVIGMFMEKDIVRD